MADVSLKIKGMTCASCVARVEKIAGKIDGIESVSVNLATEKLNFKTPEQDIVIPPLAVLGMLNPMVAAVAMAFSSVSVVSNSLRLRRAGLDV